MTGRIALIITLFLVWAETVSAQGVAVRGTVTVEPKREAAEFAYVFIKETGLYAITDDKGRFAIRNVPHGRFTVSVQSMGYATLTIPIVVGTDDITLDVTLKPDNLQLDEVEVVARRRTDEATTSYTIDRQTLDNQQIINVGDITSLLPGGKSVNPSLMNDSRIALRSGSGEKGNAAFGTAVEVDGVRMGNNAETGETSGASTRSLGASNIESVEIVTGIPSVEYGDLSNGIVKVNTRRGKSPFVFEAGVNQHTRQVALSKGFELGRRAGMLNLSVEHARSFSDIASPHTAYQRNVLSMRYTNVLMKERAPLTMSLSLRGNIGGYNSEADPDEHLDSYRRSRDNNFSGSLRLNWLLNKTWITSLDFTGSLTYADKRSETYSNESSASTQPYIHATTQGYHIAEDFVLNPQASIVLGPTGYWYLRTFNDTKPVDWSMKLKATWIRQFGRLTNRLLLGAEWTNSRNDGRGTYYEDMRYAPTWREYRYDKLPAMNNVALYVEDKVSLPVGLGSTFELTAGLREDITAISGSEYGSVSSLSPRFNSRYVFFEGRKGFVGSLSLHAGWGKSVKLPSFQTLYPSPAYSDRLAFSSTSDAQNRSYYAYFTYPQTAQYNPALRWQHTHQIDIGVELRTRIADISLSFFHNKTFNPYMATAVYTPYSYNYTSPAALQQSGIAVADRQFAIDPTTGVVTVSDATGATAPVTLAYNTRNTYVSNTRYANASPVSRYGLEWIVDFAQIRPLRTQIRLDGNYYHYKGLDETLFADVPNGVNSRMTNGEPYQYIGYYRGGNATSTNYTANASVANGALTRRVNLNATATTHIPKIRLIVSLRVEGSLYHYSRSLSQLSDGSRGYAVASGSDYFGPDYDGTTHDQTIVVYPDYYSTWANPDERIPFAERFVWAKDNDRALFSDLAQLVVRSNYPYTMNPNRLSAYWSANFSVTKEIGNHVSLSFYANNFLNTMKQVHASQTDLSTSLFGSSYVPSFYYGLSLRLKL